MMVNINSPREIAFFIHFLSEKLENNDYSDADVEETIFIIKNTPHLDGAMFLWCASNRNTSFLLKIHKPCASYLVNLIQNLDNTAYTKKEEYENFSPEEKQKIAEKHKCLIEMFKLEKKENNK